MNNLQYAQDELLREAAKAGNQICKLKHSGATFIKARRGYSHPEEIRAHYVRAFDQLIVEGKLKLVLENKDLELYALVDDPDRISSKAHARQLLMEEAGRAAEIYKIHSCDGEFVQIGSRSFCDIDDERILFLEALGELARQNKLRLVWDSKELCRYELTRPAYGTDADSTRHLNSFGSSSYAA
jgi:hypothetical protein